MIAVTDERKWTESVRKLIWWYFWLWVLEGALRKWIVPGLSTPLLVIRDPLLFMIYAAAFQKRMFPTDKWMLVMVLMALVMGVVGAFTSENPMVALWGIRCNFLHVPLIFVIGRAFTIEDVVEVGKWVLKLSLPMAVIGGAQFIAGANSWLNVAAGGEGVQMGFAFGKIRTSGTFPFSTDLVSFLSLQSAFVLYAVLATRYFSRNLFWIGLGSLIMSVVVCGSRSAFVAVAAGYLILFVLNFTKGQWVGKFIKIIFATATLGLLLSTTELFQEGYEATKERFEVAGSFRDSVIGRFIDMFEKPFENVIYAPPLGHGIGVGTNVGTVLTEGKYSILDGEKEWCRIVGEGGVFLGVPYIIFRCSLLVMLFTRGMRSFKQGNPLPLFVLSAVWFDILHGQWGRVSALGFTVLAAGLSLAANNMPNEQTQVDERPQPVRGRRGRSIYAEKLHGRGEVA